MDGAQGKTHELQQNNDERRTFPRWLPITLLTVTTAALTVPAVLLWRQKQALRPQISSGSRRITPPPARRRPLFGPNSTRTQTDVRPTEYSTPSAPPPRRISVPARVVGAASASKRRAPAPPILPPLPDMSLLNTPLLSLGALGIATAAVGVGAVLGAWGVQLALGVENVDEFAARIRQLMLSHMSFLLRRIYRPPRTEDGPLPPSSREDVEPNSRRNEAGEWTWEAAEDRLRAAFDQGGIGEWAVCAIHELEAEEKAERRKRGL